MNQHHGNRVEDRRLITGAGKYASDWNAPGQSYGHFVRADRAHAQIVGVHTAAVRASPGVQHVFTGADAVAAGYTRVSEKLEPSQISYAHGEFRSGGDGRVIRPADLAKAGTLSFSAEGQFSSTFPNSCHVVEIEIDPDTGAARVVSYCAVDDCGVIINHAIVEGQLHGGVTQGAGQVFGEHIVYDPVSGQMLSASFMDYPMPRAGMIPELRMLDHPTPSKVSPIGVKGMGETGCTASLPALVDGVLDALRPLGVGHLDMPLTPSKIWHAIQAEKTSQGARRDGMRGQ